MTTNAYIGRGTQASYMANRPSEYRLRENAIRLNKQHPLGMISIAKLCRESNLSRRAFYNQYTSLSDFYAHCKKDFEDEMDSFIVEILKNNYNLRTSIFKILTFMERYHALFRATLINDDFSLLMFLIQSMKPLIMDEWRENVSASEISYTRLMQFYRILAFRLAEKMDIWVRWQDCAENEIPELQRSILKLIEDYRMRLKMEKF